MAINEVFPNPTVKSVHFEVRYPNLLYLDNLIGEFQKLIMKEFPISKEGLRRQIVFADVGPESILSEITENFPHEGLKRIWQFESERGVKLVLQTSSLNIHSTQHKTYQNPQSPEKFRDVISRVVGAFLEVTEVPIFERIGLRYQDECPIKELTNDSIGEYYNSTFPLNRFNISDALDMQFSVTIKREDCFLRYIEALALNENGPKLILDFDGFKNTINSEDYLGTSDRLRNLISNEFESTIREPVYRYMRNEMEVPDGSQC